MDFVLDCSVLLTWCFEDEKTEATEKLIEKLPDWRNVIAPNMLLIELVNSLLVSQRRMRITQEGSKKFIEDFFSMPITLEPNLSKFYCYAIKDLAEKHSLTSYDATYLELAIRRNLPLATKDKTLAKAAKKEGIKCLI